MVCQLTFVIWRLPRYDEWGTGWRIVVDASQPSNNLLADICVVVIRDRVQSHESAPPVWYSMTRVSKKFLSFLRSIISLIHGNGFSSFG